MRGIDRRLGVLFCGFLLVFSFAFVRSMAPNASNKRVLIVSRLMVVLLGIWALYQAMGTESVLKKALYAYTVYSAALTPVILAAFYSKRATAARTPAMPCRHRADQPHTGIVLDDNPRSCIAHPLPAGQIEAGVVRQTDTGVGRAADGIQSCSIALDRRTGRSI